MVLPQEIPIIKNILKFFNKEYKTQINYSDEEKLIENIGLENNNSVEKGLFYAVFSLFKQNGFKFDKVVELETINKKIEDLAINSISKSKTHKISNDYLLIISTKFLEGFNEEGRFGRISKRNDFAVLDYGLNKFYCQSSNIKRKFNESLLEKNIAPKKQSPEITTSKSFSKLFSIKKLFIYDVEFHKVRDFDIIDFYIRAGSKKTPINKKIKEIISKVIKDFGAYNLKSLLVAINRKPKERIRLNMVEEGMGLYKLIMSPKGIKPETKEILIKLFKDNKINLDSPLKFKDEPMEFTIFSLIKKRKIKGYNALYKQEIQKWDKNKLLNFDRGRLKINQENLIRLIKNLTKKDFELIEDQSIQISGSDIHGYILKRKKDGKGLFFLIRNSQKNFKEIEKLLLNGIIPFFYLETKLEKKDDKLSFLFTSLNNHDENSFTFLLNNILNNPQLYKTLEKNFKWSCEKIRNIKQFLAQKSSQKKGDAWELICNSILNYLFKESFPLGKAYLPDGITFFTKDDSIIWDSKALNGKKSYLNQSVQTKNRKSIKDTFYIEVFKERGFAFDYYVYLTSGVEKKDFEKVKKRIDSYLNNKKLKVGIACITDRWIKGMVEYISESANLLRIQNNKEDFINLLKAEFEKGYLENFNKDIFDIIGKSTFNQDLTELRRLIKEKMNQKN